jgi:IS30 family transposase
MKQRYTKLTQEERYCLYTMSKQEISLRSMAKSMGRSHTSLSRNPSGKPVSEATGIPKPRV